MHPAPGIAQSLVQGPPARQRIPLNWRAVPPWHSLCVAGLPVSTFTAQQGPLPGAGFSKPAGSVAPLVPAGTIVHIISWHDNTVNNKGNNDAENWIGYGQRTIDDMSHAWITYYTMTEDDYKQAVAERKTIQGTKAKPGKPPLSAVNRPQ